MSSEMYRSTVIKAFLDDPRIKELMKKDGRYLDIPGDGDGVKKLGSSDTTSNNHNKSLQESGFSHSLVNVGNYSSKSRENGT